MPASASVASAAKLLARMDDLEHQSPEKEYTGLHYGDKGTAKTLTSVALAQRLKGSGGILFVDSADGYVSLDRFPALKKDVKHIRVDDPRELMTLSRAFRSNAAGYRDFSVVLLDEYSSWWTDTLHSFAREQAGVTEDEELPIIDWTWYGPPQQAMLNVIKNFQKAQGLHVIMTAHEQGRPIKGETNGADRVMPLLGTKLSAGIGQISHVVARFESRRVKDDYIREVQILPTRYVDAKSRIPHSPLKLDTVSFVDLVADWVGAGEMAADVAEQMPSQEDFEIPAEDGEDEG